MALSHHRGASSSVSHLLSPPPWEVFCHPRVSCMLGAPYPLVTVLSVGPTISPIVSVRKPWSREVNNFLKITQLLREGLLLCLVWFSFPPMLSALCSSLSRVQLFATPRTVAQQALLPMEFSRQEYWSGLLFPSPRDLPDSETEPRSPALQADSLLSEPPGKPHSTLYPLYIHMPFWKLKKKVRR